MNRDNLELRHLRYFTAVARTGTITAAANYLHISQPALTYQLKQIEEELGLQLLERNSRGVSLTKAGTVFLAKAEAVLDEFEAINRALAPLRKSESLRIIVGMTPTPARALAIDLMEANARSGPFAVDIREGFGDDLLKMVVLGELDCALSNWPASHRSGGKSVWPEAKYSDCNVSCGEKRSDRARQSLHGLAVQLVCRGVCGEIG